MKENLTEKERIHRYFNSHQGDIRYVFAPFIQERALDKIVPDDKADTIVITRWRAADIVSGVSDLEVFRLCEERGYTLKIHPQLHAKVYSWDLEDGMIGSSNVTKSGLGIGKNPNVEVLSEPIYLSLRTQVKLRKVDKESDLVTIEDYERALDYVDEEEVEKPDYGDIDIGKDPRFLVSQLPMTEDPNLLIDVLTGDNKQTLEDLSPEERRCVLHDIATFDMDELNGEPKDEVRAGLKDRFENHVFIDFIIDNIDPDMYFGEMKELVQTNCGDVPTPSRRELTENVHVLYQWFPKVAPERFKRDVPGAHSERLRDSKKV
jgi:hypothetical protein